jgi:hypothetical protein
MRTPRSPSTARTARGTQLSGGQHQRIAIGPRPNQCTGDIIMTRTPAGVAARSPGDRIERGVDGVGMLKVTVGKPT